MRPAQSSVNSLAGRKACPTMAGWKPCLRAMQISTTHFGPVEIEIDDILLFPHGIVAFEDCRHWVLLSDEENPALAWLQSVGSAEVALPVVSPRRFAPEYAVHVGRGQLLPLEFSQFDQAYVL